MRIISRKALVEFWQEFPEAEQPLKAWHKEVEVADWARPDQVKEKHRNASILKNGRVVFNIAGNKFRLVAWINYECRIVYIRFVGTHREYDNIDTQTI